jgi:hypothetical protein
MNFVVRTLVSLVKAFIIFYGLQIPAIAQDLQCSPFIRKVRQCVDVEHHPSGPRVTIDWLSAKEKLPYRREIKGARSGSFVIGGSRLFFDTEQTWMIVRSNGAKVPLLSSNERLPKVILRFREAGHAWKIRVTHQDVPVSIVGVATEGEMKLDLEITRIK